MYEDEDDDEPGDGEPGEGKPEEDGGGNIVKIFRLREDGAEEEMEEGDEDDEIVIDDDSPNLVLDLEGSYEGRRILKKIASKVLRDFEAAESGSKDYRESIAEAMKIFNGDLPPKSWPFEDCANAHVPSMFENVMRIVSHIYGELFGDWKTVYGVMSNGNEDKAVADLLSIHGNWQIRYDISDFPRQMERAVMFSILSGDVSCHSYWDHRTQRNRHEVLTPDEVYVPYARTSTKPDYSDCPYIVRVLEQSRADLQAMRGIWEHVDDVIEGASPSWDDDPEDLLRIAVNETLGIDSSDEDGSAPFKILHYEGWDGGLLPGQERDRYIQAIVCPKTRHVLRLAIHEAIDWKEEERWRIRQDELDAYREQLAQYEAAIIHSQGLEDAYGAVDPAATGALPAAPIPPAWMSEGEGAYAPQGAARKQPIHMFSHGVCIEPLRGTLGVGYGRSQADYNRGMNTAMSQFIDGATLANSWTIMTTKRVSFEEDFGFGPGKVNRVTGVSGSELRDNIIEMKPQPASGQLLQVVDRLYGFAQSSMQAPAVLSGESGKAGETYRGLSARIEQATKQLSVTAQKHGMGFVRQVLINNARLNSVFLPEYELVTMMDWQSMSMVTRPITRAMYERNYRVELSADLRFTSEAQRVQEATDMVAMASQIPELQGNLAFKYEALRKLLIARKQYDMIPLLGSRPQTQETFGPPPAPTAPAGPGMPPVPGQQGGPPG